MECGGWSSALYETSPLRHRHASLPLGGGTYDWGEPFLPRASAGPGPADPIAKNIAHPLKYCRKLPMTGSQLDKSGRRL